MTIAEYIKNNKEYGTDHVSIGLCKMLGRKKLPQGDNFDYHLDATSSTLPNGNIFTSACVMAVDEIGYSIIVEIEMTAKFKIANKFIGSVNEY